MSTPETKAKNPITLKIKFKSASLDQFIERYSVDVSKGGIFIRTKDPLPVGAQLKFEFQLQDGSPLLAGEGTVVWNRNQDQAKANAAPGMGVRFDRLTGDSQNILERILGEKVRRGEGQVESRYDAGMRIAAGLPDPTPQSQKTPDQGGFGDEPTRAMAADQVNRLAEQSAMGSTNEEDRPTKAGAVPSPEDIRKAMGAAVPDAQPMSPIAPIKPPPGLGKTLLGQGFMLPRGPGVPAPAGKDGPSVEIKREPSGVVPSPASVTGGLPESAKTPQASPDEQQARIADSARTPTGGAAPRGPEPVAAAAAVDSAPTPAPVSAGIAISTPTPLASESQPVSASRSASAPPTSGGGSKALLIGGVVLLIVLGALGYVMYVQPRMTGTTTTTTPPDPTVGTVPTTTGQQNPQPKEQGSTATPVTPTTPVEVKPTDPPKTTEVPVKPMVEGVEVVTEPAGAMLDIGGKPFGPTPIRVPGLDVGSRIKITLRGFAEATPRLRNKPDETKPLVFKLTPVQRLIEVGSNVRGAEVFVNGTKIGKTPIKGYVIESGKSHEVEVRRSGYVTWKQTVTDASTFVIKNKKEVLTLNAALEAEGGKKRGGHSSGDSAPSGGTEGKATPAPGGKTTPAPGGKATPAPGGEPAKPEAPKPAEPTDSKGTEPAKAEKAAEPKAEKAPEAPKPSEPAKPEAAPAPAP